MKCGPLHTNPLPPPNYSCDGNLELTPCTRRVIQHPCLFSVQIWPTKQTSRVTLLYISNSLAHTILLNTSDDTNESISCNVKQKTATLFQILCSLTHTHEVITAQGKANMVYRFSIQQREQCIANNNPLPHIPDIPSTLHAIKTSPAGVESLFKQLSTKRVQHKMKSKHDSRRNPLPN